MAPTPLPFVGIPDHFRVAPEPAKLALRLGLADLPEVPEDDDGCEAMWEEVRQGLSGAPGKAVLAALLPATPPKGERWVRKLREAGLSREETVAAAWHARTAIVAAADMDPSTLGAMVEARGGERERFIRDGEVDRHASAVWLYAVDEESLPRAVFLGMLNERGRLPYDLEPATFRPADWKAKVVKAAKPHVRFSDISGKAGTWQETFVEGGVTYMVARQAAGRSVGNLLDGQSRDAARVAQERIAVVWLDGNGLFVSASRAARWAPRLEAFAKTALANQRLRLTPRAVETDADAILRLVDALTSGSDQCENDQDRISLASLRIMPYSVGTQAVTFESVGIAPLRGQLEAMRVINDVATNAAATERIGINFRQRKIELTRVDEPDGRMRLAYCGTHPDEGRKLGFERRLAAPPYRLNLSHHPGVTRSRAAESLADFARRVLRSTSFAENPSPGQLKRIAGWAESLGTQCDEHRWRCAAPGEASEHEEEAGTDACPALIAMTGSGKWDDSDDRSRDERAWRCDRGHQRRHRDLVARAPVSGVSFTLDRGSAAKLLLQRAEAAIGVPFAETEPGARWTVVYERRTHQLALAFTLAELPREHARANEAWVVAWAGRAEEDVAARASCPHTLVPFADIAEGDVTVLERHFDGVKVPTKPARSADAGLPRRAVLDVADDEILINGSKPRWNSPIREELLRALVRETLARTSGATARCIRFSDLWSGGAADERKNANDAMGRLVKTSGKWCKAKGQKAEPVILHTVDGYRFDPTRVRIRLEGKDVWPPRTPRQAAPDHSRG